MYSSISAGGMVLADAGDFDHMSGFGWGLMGMGWIFMIAVIGLIIWAVLRATSDSSKETSPTASAERVLAERYARGEIDDEEYRRRSDELRR